MIGVSEKIAEANPALAAWLSSAGLASAIFAARDGWAAGLAVFAAGEEICAAPYDLIIDFGTISDTYRSLADYKEADRHLRLALDLFRK